MSDLEPGSSYCVVPTTTRIDSVLGKSPRVVIDAVLMAEARRFWTHPGIDPLAVARALHVTFKRNEFRQGASTITQQVARTVFLDTRRTWERKLRESAVALTVLVQTTLNPALRQAAGSALSQGIVRIEKMRPELDNWEPHNMDGQFHGPVRFGGPSSNRSIYGRYASPWTSERDASPRWPVRRESIIR